MGLFGGFRREFFTHGIVQVALSEDTSGIHRYAVVQDICEGNDRNLNLWNSTRYL